MARILETTDAARSSTTGAINGTLQGEITMKRTAIFVAAVALCAVCSVNADYTVTNSGTWPSSWTKGLEPLRGQARTYEGPLAADRHYAIPFTKREEFEAAWP